MPSREISKISLEISACRADFNAPLQGKRLRFNPRGHASASPRAMIAKRSDSSASATSWIVRASSVPPLPSAVTGGASCPHRSVVRKPRSSAARAVELTHICAMKPASTMFLRPLAASCACKSVPAKAFGSSFSITSSSREGSSSATMAPRSAERSNRPPALTAMGDVDDRSAALARSREQRSRRAQLPGLASGRARGLPDIRSGCRSAPARRHRGGGGEVGTGELQQGPCGRSWSPISRPDGWRPHSPSVACRCAGILQPLAAILQVATAAGC